MRIYKRNFNLSEMEAKKFRIGNYLRSKQWFGHGQIQGIEETENGFQLKVKGYVHEWEKGKYFDLEEIPLTEQWLIDLGFEKQVLSDNSAHYYTLELNDNKYCDLSICSGDKNGFIEATLFPYEDWFRYKYVHELQNLFFAITGQELELKHESSTCG